MRNHKCQWNSFLRFCISNRLQVFPPVIDNIVRFYTKLVESLKSYSSLQNYQSSIALLYKVYGYQVDTSSILIKLLNMSAKKSLNTAPATKRPLDTDQLIAMIQAVDPGDPFQVTFIAAVTVGFFGLLRRSNICPPSPQQYDPSKHLRRQDLLLTSDGLVINLRWSKTNQDSSKVFQIPVAWSGHQVLDPPRIFRDFDAQFKVLPDDPCFSFYWCNKLYILTHKDLSSMLSSFMSKLGFETDGVTTHSIRKGGATLLHRAGIMIPDLKQHGTWRSDSYKHYIDYNIKDRLQVTKSVYKFLKLF